MQPDNTNERQKLLDRFLTEIQAGGQPFFDEDDLIEIYDYANDLGDEYAQLEIINCASRLYPTSVPLAERKAYYYYDLGNDEAARTALASLPPTSVLGDILSVLLDKPRPAVAAHRLDAILDSVDSLDDEEVIQLVDAASDLQLYDWMLKRQDKIRQLCSEFPQAFLYELIGVAEMKEDYETAVKLGEQLTDLEPFNCEFWELLADIHIEHLKEFDKGLNDVEFALAINPDSSRALYLKARALYELSRPTDEILKPIQRVMKITPDDPMPVHFAAMVLFDRESVSEATDMLEAFRKKHPDDLTTVEYLTLLRKGNVRDDIFAPLFESPATADSNAEHLAGAARNYADQGEFATAAALLLAVSRRHPLDDLTEFLFETLYRTGAYNEIIERWPGVDIQWRTMVTDYVYALSLMRTGRCDEAFEKVPPLLVIWQSLPDTIPYAKQLQRNSFVNTLVNLQYSYLSTGKYPVDTLDILRS